MNSPQIATTQLTDDSSHRAVAPGWHTAIVLFVLLGFSLLGAVTDRLPGLGSGRVAQYLLVIVVEWGIVAFIGYGVSRRGFRLSDLVGGRWSRRRDVWRDIGIGLGFLIVCGVGILDGLGYLLKAAPNSAIRNALPQSRTEVILWVMMSLSAGFCEELIFRGYLQRQFATLTHAAASGIVLQGIAFGAAHGYQGWKLMFLISVYGTLFGLLARWRRSLRPGMITHAVQDSLGGLLGRHLMG